MKKNREVWKAAATPRGDLFPDYEVSDQGAICRVTDSTCGKVGDILTTNKAKTGYHVIGLHKDGKRYWFLVHRLMCASFHGLPRTHQKVVRHLDGSRDNNAASNLRWGTYLENEQDRELHGRTKGARGSRQHKAKLTDKQVISIRKAITAGRETQRRIAIRFGVSQSNISHIKNNKNWGWLSNA